MVGEFATALPPWISANASASAEVAGRMTCPRMVILSAAVWIPCNMTGCPMFARGMPTGAIFDPQSRWRTPRAGGVDERDSREGARSDPAVH
jgi:hypothetical protein